MRKDVQGLVGTQLGVIIRVIVICVTQLQLCWFRIMAILGRIARSRIQKFLYSRTISNVKEGFVRLPKALPPEPAPG